jgi:hypothetical protein
VTVGYRDNNSWWQHGCHLKQVEAAYWTETLGTVMSDPELLISRVILPVSQTDTLSPCSKVLDSRRPQVFTSQRGLVPPAWIIQLHVFCNLFHLWSPDWFESPEFYSLQLAFTWFCSPTPLPEWTIISSQRCWNLGRHCSCLFLASFMITTSLNGMNKSRYTLRHIVYRANKRKNINQKNVRLLK